MLLDYPRLVFVKLVPSKHPVVIDLVDKLERLSFGCPGDTESTLEVDYTERVVRRALTLEGVSVFELHLVGLDGFLTR